MSKVLYVDDNDDNVCMLKMRLELLGDFEVITAEDGEKGCEMAGVGEAIADIITRQHRTAAIRGWTPCARRFRPAS
jgi:CheY-like chemotaxis protein